MCVPVTCPSSDFSRYSATGFHMNVTAVLPSTYSCVMVTWTFTACFCDECSKALFILLY